MSQDALRDAMFAFFRKIKNGMANNRGLALYQAAQEHNLTPQQLSEYMNRNRRKKAEKPAVQETQRELAVKPRVFAYAMPRIARERRQWWND